MKDGISAKAYVSKDGEITIRLHPSPRALQLLTQEFIEASIFELETRGAPRDNASYRCPERPESGPCPVCDDCGPDGSVGS